MDFLKALEREGFTIGVDTCLRVAAVWKNLPHPLDRDAAQDYLCPLIALSPAEQEKFRRIFPDYAHLLGLEAPPEKEATKEVSTTEFRRAQPKKPNSRRYLLLTLLLALSLSAAAYLAYNRYFKPEKETVVQPSTPTPEGPNSPTPELPNASTPELPNAPTPPKRTLTGPAQADSVSYRPSFEPYAVAMPSLTEVRQDFWYWLSRYKALFSAILYVLLLTGALGIYLWMRAQRRYAARQERGDEPPYQLPIKINRHSAIAVGPEFMTAINRLRGREASERLRLNVARTVAATIRRGGLIDFRFDAYTRPVEYLLLIDKNSEQNHQAQLFEFIYQHLLRQEVHAERFFFDGVPLWCWNERHPEGLLLERLKHLHRDARLIVLSNGYGFISAVTGELEEWTAQLAGWNRRALLTPAPLAGWNYREATLGQFFQVLPSSIEGMTQVVRHFEQLPTPSLRDWKYELGASDRPLDIDPEQVNASLSGYFSAAMLRWISACALYPELHWDLTLRLGEALSTPGDAPLVTFENVAALARLPWFRQGYMPNAVRSQLLEFRGLSGDDRQRVRGAIVRVLEDNIPDNPNSYAYDEHQLHLAINQLLLARVPAEKQRWLQKYRELHARGIKGDHVSIVELDRRFNRLLDFPLPQRLRNFLFQEGRGVLGLRPRVPLLLAGLLALGVWGLGRLIPDPCPGKLVQMPATGAVYCLSSGADSLDFYTLEIAGYLQRLRPDSARARAQDVAGRFPAGAALDAFFLRLRRLQWNEALGYYRKPAALDTALLLLQTPLPGDSLPPAIANDYRHLLGLALWGRGQRPEAQSQAALLDTAYLRRIVPNLTHLLAYDFVDSMHEGRVRVRLNARYGFLDSLGQPLWAGLQPPYDFAYNYAGGRALVTRGLEQCFIARDGRTRLECFTRLLPYEDTQTRRWGYENEQGTQVIAPQYDSAWAFSPEGIARVKSQGRFGFIRQDGSALGGFGYARARDFRNGLAAVQRNGKWGYLGSQGQEILPPLYDEAGDFNAQGEAPVRLGARRFTINAAGRCMGGDCPPVRYRGQVTGQLRDGAPEVGPIAGVTVRLEGLAQPMTTDRQGEFTFELPGREPPESRRITLSKSGYEEAQYRPEILDADQDPIRLAPLTLRLVFSEPNIQLRGTVRDSATGQPLSGVRVTHRDIAASTNASGQYTLELPHVFNAPEYALQFSKEGYTSRSVALRPGTGNALPEVRLGQVAPIVDVPRPTMVSISGGTFQMGDVMGDKEQNDETVHSVTLSGFQLGAYEVTFEEYDAFCTATGRTKPNDQGWGRGRRPVINVSWEDVVAYCNWLSTQHGFQPVYTISGSNVTANWNANGYRLPTEAEWEYAAREGGKKVRFGNGKDIADPKEINFNGSADYKKPYSVVGEYRERTVIVGSFRPNALGLYDMSGNVWEWCWDWYGTYPSSAQTNPRGPNTGSFRVYRGGSWYGLPAFVRVARRYGYTPDGRFSSLGFRLARAQ